MDAPDNEERERGLRACCRGIVRDLSNWSDLPAVSLAARARYVVRGDRMPWLLLIVVAVVVAAVLLHRGVRSLRRTGGKGKRAFTQGDYDQLAQEQFVLERPAPSAPPAASAPPVPASTSRPRPIPRPAVPAMVRDIKTAVQEHSVPNVKITPT